MSNRHFKCFLALSALLVAGSLALAGCSKSLNPEAFSGKLLTQIAEESHS